MNFFCVVCSDQFTEAEDIFYTRCGHVFHFKCITQWLEKSKTCPTCREKTTRNRIHKLYLDVSNETTRENDPQTEELIASLKFQISLKDKDANHFMSKSQLLEKQNNDLRDEAKKLESEANEKNATISALKEQLEGYEGAKNEIIQLRNKIEELKNVQKLLDMPIDEVKSFVGKTKDPSTLIKYISVVKAENVTFLTELKNLKTNLKNVLQENAKLSQTFDTFPRCYSDSRVLGKLIQYKNERLTLQERVDELEKILGIAASPNRISSPLSDSVKVLDERLQGWFSRGMPRKSIDGTRKNAVSTVTSQNAEDIASRSNVQRNDASSSSSFVEILDIPITSKRPRLSTMHEEQNDRRDAQFDNRNESVLRNSQHRITRSSSTSVASTVPKERNLRSRKMTHQEAEIIDLTL